MKTCMNCKNINDDDSVFCKHCGMVLNSGELFRTTISKLDKKSSGDDILASMKHQISFQLSENRNQDIELLKQIRQMNSRFNGLLEKVDNNERDLWGIINKVEESVLSLQSAQT